MATCEHLTKHGITKSDMHSALINRFSLTEEQACACDSYFILHWEGSHFKSELTNGVLKRSDGDYLVVYKDCKPTQIKPGTTLWLSFRRPAKEFNLQAYVIVVIRD